MQPNRTYRKLLLKFSTGQPAKSSATAQLQYKHGECGTRRGNSTTRTSRDVIRVHATTGKLLSIGVRSGTEIKRYLIDTGSGINLVKRSSATFKPKKTVAKTFYMGNDKYQTDETVDFQFFNIMNTFHVVPDDIPLIEDAIIGLPMLSNYSYQISNESFFQAPKTILPGQIKIETIYLDQVSTRVCFCNTGEQLTIITNDLSYEHDLDKVAKMKQIIRLDHIEDKLRIPIEKILLHYIDVFDLESDTLPCTNLTKHTITLRENKIANTKSYRPPEAHKAEIEKQMKKC